MPKLLTKKGQDATDENYFIGGTVERLHFNHRDYRQLIVLQFDKANTQKNTPAQLVGNFVFEQFVLQDDVTYCPRKARKNS